MKPINLTIVMTTYNRAELLRENIEHLLTSNYFFELLIIDDHSKDATEEVVKSFNDPRITYYRNPYNRGYPVSLNEGIQRAGNPNILFCEDDAFIVNPDGFFRILMSEISYKTIIATHLLLDGKEKKTTLVQKIKNFFAESLAGEVYCHNGRERRIVKFCNNCFCFNKTEISTRFNTSSYKGKVLRIESDFQIRARKEGARIVYNPKLVIDHRHYSSGGLRVHDRDELLYQRIVSHLSFLKLHYSIWNLYAYALLGFLGHPNKMAIVTKAIRDSQRQGKPIL